MSASNPSKYKRFLPTGAIPTAPPKAVDWSQVGSMQDLEKKMLAENEQDEIATAQITAYSCCATDLASVAHVEKPEIIAKYPADCPELTCGNILSVILAVPKERLLKIDDLTMEAFKALSDEQIWIKSLFEQLESNFQVPFKNGRNTYGLRVRDLTIEATHAITTRIINTCIMFSTNRGGTSAHGDWLKYLTPYGRVVTLLLIRRLMIDSNRPRLEAWLPFDHTAVQTGRVSPPEATNPFNTPTRLDRAME